MPRPPDREVRVMFHRKIRVLLLKGGEQVLHRKSRFYCIYDGHGNQNTLSHRNNANRETVARFPNKSH